MRADDANHPFVDVVEGEEVAQFNSGEAALVEVQVAALVADDLVIDRVDSPQSPAIEGIVVVRGWLRAASESAFPRWLRELNTRDYTPMLQHAADAALHPAAASGGSISNEGPAVATLTNGDAIGTPKGDPVVLRVYRGVARRAHGSLLINVLLYIVTWVSTLYAGVLYQSDISGIASGWDLLQPQILLRGFPFAATLLGILTAHELGHYFAARYHKVDVTLPYFIPMPFMFGTMGAFIMMREPISDRRKLFDIGVAGPLAGLALAIPLLFYGLTISEVGPLPTASGYLMEGNSLLYLGAKYLVFGEILPNFATGRDVVMSPVTFGAWIGLLVTALNLLPLGQLDGGHAIYAMFGRRSRLINLATLGIMALLGIAGMQWAQQIFPALAEIGSTSWFVWILFMLFLMGPYHPPPLDDVTTIGQKRMLVGILLFLILLLILPPAIMRFV